MVTDRGPSLVEAAPFVERFAGQFVVVKLGGELLDAGPALERIAPQVAVLARCGLFPVLVHGGGRQIDVACQARSIPVEKVAGRRVTSRAVMDVVLEVVAGDLNRTICALLERAGVATRGFARGVSAAVRCRLRPPVVVDGRPVDYGRVGDVDRIDTDALLVAPADRRVPVLPSIGQLADGGHVNVNADTVACRLAVALGAQKLVLLSRVAGVMGSPGAAGPVSELDPAGVRRLLESGAVTGGMRPKLEEALAALAGGVRQVHIVSGLEPWTLLREIFTEEGCGTLIGPGKGTA